MPAIREAPNQINRRRAGPTWAPFLHPVHTGVSPHACNLYVSLPVHHHPPRDRHPRGHPPQNARAPVDSTPARGVNVAPAVPALAVLAVEPPQGGRLPALTTRPAGSNHALRSCVGTTRGRRQRGVGGHDLRSWARLVYDGSWVETAAAAWGFLSVGVVAVTQRPVGDIISTDMQASEPSFVTWLPLVHRPRNPPKLKHCAPTTRARKGRRHGRTVSGLSTRTLFSSSWQGRLSA